jgi:hypothetical protein
VPFLAGLRPGVGKGERGAGEGLFFAGIMGDMLMI